MKAHGKNSPQCFANLPGFPIFLNFGAVAFFASGAVH